MTVMDSYKRHRIDWICVQRAFLLTMGFFFAFAAGGWLVSIRVQEASLAYKNRSTAQLEVIHKEVGSNPVAQIQCDRKVAAAVATVLKEKNADTTPVSALPVQVCPPPKLSPSQTAPK